MTLKRANLCMYSCLLFLSFSIKKFGSNWIGWSLGNVFIYFLTHIGPPNIFHHEVFSTLRYFLNTDIFGHKEFSTQRHSWLHLFWPSDIFHHEEFSTQLQFLSSWSITSWKRVSHHCSDRITYIKLIQNKSLTPIPHK